MYLFCELDVCHDVPIEVSGQLVVVSSLSSVKFNVRLGSRYSLPANRSHQPEKKKSMNLSKNLGRILFFSFVSVIDLISCIVRSECATLELHSRIS